MPDRFYVGQGIKVIIEYRDATNSLVDPSVPSVGVNRPDGTTSIYVYPTNPEYVRDSVGRYHFNLTITQAGNWFVKGAGTGGLTATTEIEFRGLATHV